MNSFLRLLVIFCMCCCSLHLLGAIKVVEKEVNLGEELEVAVWKKVKINAFAFLKDNEEVAEETIWYGVFPFQEEFIFYLGKKGQALVCPVNMVLTTAATTTIEFDKEMQPKIVDKDKKATSLLTMQISFSPEVKLFKEFVILIVNGDKKALQTFVTKHTTEAIISVALKAQVTLLLNQGNLSMIMDDNVKFENIINGKIHIEKPTQLTGKFVFISERECLAALSSIINEEENAQQEAQQKDVPTT